MSAAQPVITVQGLTMGFGSRTILEDISFDILSGEILSSWVEADVVNPRCSSI